MITPNYRLFYTDWESESNPLPNAFKPTSRTDVFLKGDFHFILQNANKEFELVKNTDDPFIYHIHLRLTDTGKNLWTPLENYIPNELIPVINQKGIIVVTDDEGHDIGPQLIKDHCVKAGIKLDRVIYITPNTKSCEDQIITTRFYSNPNNKIMLRLKTEKESIKLFKSMLNKDSSHFLASLNLRCDEHKIYLMNELYRRGFLNKENHITFYPPVPKQNEQEFLEPLIDTQLRKLLPIIDEFMNDVDLQTAQPKTPWGFQTAQAYSKCKIVIMNMSPTRGTLRAGGRRFSLWNNWQPTSAIMLKKPFIMHGEDPRLSEIKYLGFKTFDNIWDESYDEESNLKTKARKIVDLVETIKKDTQVLKMCKETTEFNFKRLFSLTYNQDIIETIDKVFNSNKL